MRILVLGHARSGSTSLLNYIAESKGYKAIGEPSNPIYPRNYREEEVWEEDNVVVKELYHHMKGSKKYKEQYKTYREKFDKIVVIYREDLQETYESIIHARITTEYFTPYTFNESEVTFFEVSIIDKRNLIGSIKQQISALKSENFFSVTYEGLYYKGTDKKRLDDYLEITDSKGDDILDNKHRLRQST